MRPACVDSMPFVGISRYEKEEFMAKGELRMFAVKRCSTGQMLLVAGRSKFEACEALAGVYPDEDAADFEFVPDSVLEVLTGEFGGAFVPADTID